MRCACWWGSPKRAFCGLLLYLTYWFPAHYRARANALFMIAMPVTMALGSLVSGYILSMDGLMALKGWQWLFLLEGLPSVLLGVIVWFYLDDSPAKAKWLTEEDKTCLSAMMEKDRLNREQPERQHAESGLWRDVLTPTVMLYTVAYFCSVQHAERAQRLDTLILKSFNQDSSNIAIGLLSAVPHICTIAAMIWWSKRSDRLQERKRHTLLPLRGRGLDTGRTRRHRRDAIAGGHHGLCRRIFGDGDILDDPGSLH